jgi:hypothetical protein
MIDLPTVVSGTSFPRKRESRFQISAAGGFRNDVFGTSQTALTQFTSSCYDFASSAQRKYHIKIGKEKSWFLDLILNLKVLLAV